MDPWDQLDPHTLETLDKQLLAFAAESLPLAVEALNLVEADDP